MRPTSGGPTAMRQSCDRCHGQKLRCSRLDKSGTGACDRCLRKGAPCVYSFSLPKGRPCLYETAPGSRRSRKSATPPASTVATVVNTAATPMQLDKYQQDVALDSEAPAPDIHSNATVGMDVGADASWNDDADCNGAEVFGWVASMDLGADFWASSRRPEDRIEGHMNPQSAFDLQPIPEAHFQAGSTNPDHSSNGPGGELVGYIGFGGGTGRGSHEDGLSLENSPAESSRMGSMSNNSNSGDMASSPRSTTCSELSVAHLSWLSARLSQILRARCFLVEAVDSPRQSTGLDPAMDVQPFVETAFKSINAWLVQEPGIANINLGPSSIGGIRTSGELMHQIFSASNHLLEILRYLHARIKASSPDPFTLASNHNRRGSRIGTAVSGDTPSSGPPSPVVHHLVLTCATLLLDIYVLFLSALQRCADKLSPPLLVRNLVEPNDHMDATSRGHIQLVSVVQLCSYFARRLNQTLDSTLDSQRSSAASSSQENGSQRPVPPDETFRQALEAMIDLKTDVERRLKQLEESLSIVS